MEGDTEQTPDHLDASVVTHLHPEGVTDVAETEVAVKAEDGMTMNSSQDETKLSNEQNQGEL